MGVGHTCHRMLVDVREQLVDLVLATFMWVLDIEPMPLGFEVNILFPFF